MRMAKGQRETEEFSQQQKTETEQGRVLREKPRQERIMKHRMLQECHRGGERGANRICLLTMTRAHGNL